MPKAEDTIIAHYAGSLTNGKEFDNSYKRGEPLTIKANEVIKGWTEVVQHMHIGDKVKAYIPSELGYGDRGAGADIPPGATLIFEMELLGVKPFVAAKTQKAETVPANNKPVKGKEVITKPATKTKPAVKTK
jgi:FKBP-type peptidyl-prolyl cis-trans isomerase 2